MGEIVRFPGTDMPIFDLDPHDDRSWDTIIDEAYINGTVLFQHDGKFYHLTLEEIQNGQDSPEDSPPTAA